MNRYAIIAAGLAAVVVASALAYVDAHHRVRDRVAALERLIADQEALAIEYGRLQLEESTLAAPGVIERTARTQLNMHLPSATQIKVLR